MNKAIASCIYVASFSLTACANYLYTGEITALDADGEPRKSILYWSKTKSWLAKPKAGHAVLLTECGVPVRYDQQPGRIVFRGSAGEDRIPGQPPPSGDEIECGHFVGNDSLVDIQTGDVALTVVCEGVTDEFRAVQRKYLKERTEPYTFAISVNQTTSFFGKTPDPPVTPECR